MDVASGYFARLEYTTDSQWSVPLVKDTAMLAKNAVDTFTRGSIPILPHHQNTLTENPTHLSPESVYEPVIDENGVTEQVRWLIKHKMRPLTLTSASSG